MITLRLRGEPCRVPLCFKPIKRIHAQSLGKQIGVLAWIILQGLTDGRRLANLPRPDNHLNPPARLANPLENNINNRALKHFTHSIEQIHSID